MNTEHMHTLSKCHCCDRIGPHYFPDKNGNLFCDFCCESDYFVVNSEEDGQQ